jgi:SAM-dependent methyltransferase
MPEPGAPPNAPPGTAANADQIAYWNSDAGARWVALQSRIDALFAGITDTAIRRAAPRPGERVLDIGCGCGATTLALAAQVGAEGNVLGVDVSEPMLAVAAARIRAAGLAQAMAERIDAATHPFPPASRDLAFSRFGVMFFDAPEAAFANIRTALRPGGRLCAMTWQPMEASPWFAVPYAAARPFMAPTPPPDPHAPSPFSLGDATRARQILADAGFAGIDIAAHSAPLVLAPPGEFAAAAAFATRIGPVSRALTEAGPDTTAAAEAAIAAALRDHDGPDGVTLGAAIWIVTASAK